MVRFFFFCLCWISLLFSSAFQAYAQTDNGNVMPVDAGEFLDSLGEDPSIINLYDFFDMYDEQLKTCKQNDVFLKALSYMADKGEKGMVRSKLTILSACPELNQKDMQMVQTLEHRMNLQEEALPQQQNATATASTDKENTSLSASPAPTQTATATEGAQAQVSSQTQSTPTADLNSEHKNASAAQTQQALERADEAERQAMEHSQEAEAKSTPKHLSQAQVSSKNVKEKTAPKQQAQPSGNTVRRIVPPSPQVRTALVTKTATTKPVVEPSSTASMGLATQHYYRDGDRGTSRFYLNENTASLALKNFKFSASAVYASSLGEGTQTDIGSNYLGTKKYSLHTHDLLFVPRVQYSVDDFIFELGTSPLGGTVAPLPAGKAAYIGDNLGITIFNESITDSLLAYAGFKDIYTGDKMGRVMKAGTKVEWKDNLAENWFYGLATSGAYLYGENVKENTGVKGEAYIGKSLGEFSVGIYTSADHFARDLDHFTYGHGGYYSPYLALSGVAFASWEYKDDDVRFKADVGVGHVYEEIKDSSRYYDCSGQGADYEGKFNNNFTTNTGLEAVIKINDSLDLNSSARLITSGKYFETKGNIGLNLSF